MSGAGKAGVSENGGADQSTPIAARGAVAAGRAADDAAAPAPPGWSLWAGPRFATMGARAPEAP
jgi:hypothetical protein